MQFNSKIHEIHEMIDQSFCILHSKAVDCVNIQMLMNVTMLGEMGLQSIHYITMKSLNRD